MLTWYYFYWYSKFVAVRDLLISWKRRSTEPKQGTELNGYRYSFLTPCILNSSSLCLEGRVVGQRQAKAEDTSGEAARKNFSRGSLFKTWPQRETAHEKPLAPRVWKGLFSSSATGLASLSNENANVPDVMISNRKFDISLDGTLLSHTTNLNAFV